MPPSMQPESTAAPTRASSAASWRPRSCSAAPCWSRRRSTRTRPRTKADDAARDAPGSAASCSRPRGSRGSMATAILDIDGTLVDTNFQHTLAWFRAFRQHGFVLPLWRIHRHIGMGGDQLVASLAGEGFDREHGDDVRTAEKILYTQLIGEVQPLP